MSAPLPHQVAVVIVGAGPVGMLTAVELHRLGVPVLVLDKRAMAEPKARASTLQPPVLDCLAALGLLQGLEPLGRRVDSLVSWNLDSGERRQLPFAALHGLTAHPYRLHLEQHHLVAALALWLQQRAPGSLRPGHEVIDFASLGSAGGHKSCRLLVRDAAGQVVSLAASWVVAADGARSSLRAAVGLGFPGHDLPVPVVRLFPTLLPAPLTAVLPPLAYLHRGDRSLSLLAMARGWRVILRPRRQELADALATGEPTAPDQPAPASAWSLTMLKTLLAPLVRPEAWLPETIPQDHYPVSQRRSEHHRHGSLLLAGDAAHITNTRGGLNMNFGLLEGHALAAALAAWWWGDRRRDDPLAIWAERWQRLTADVLLPRTALMVGSGPLGGVRSGSAMASEEAMETLRRATLLDLQGESLLQARSTVA